MYLFTHYFVLTQIFKRLNKVHQELSMQVSKQPHDFARFVHIDSLRSRNLRKTWHGHHVSTDDHSKPSTSRKSSIADFQCVSRGSTSLGRVSGKAVLRLGYANRGAR